MKGEGNNFYGKTHNEVSRKKISKAVTGKNMGSENPAAKKIKNNQNEFFETIRSAAMHIGVSDSAISNSIRRNHKCGGFFWEYV